MLKNYLILAFRNLRKNAVFSAINIAGLSLGLAVCITILLFVRHESGFDGMHSKNIYRLNEVQSFPGMGAPQKVALSMFPMGPTLVKEFPEIKNYVRLAPFEMAGLAYNGKKVFYENIFWADGSFFKVFDFKLLKGNASTALTAPNSVVLTEEGAARLFGKEDPMGKSLRTHNMRDSTHFIVTGIMQDVPANSHLQFNGLYSLSTWLNPADLNGPAYNWGGNGALTYLELHQDASIKKLESQFPAYLKRHMPEWAESYVLYLQSIKDIHGTSGDITHDYHNYKKFDRSYTQIFSLIAIVVLIIACVNFINLSTARSSGRAKEVGVRKSIGARRGQLTRQFVGESILMTFFAMVIACVLVVVFLPFTNELSGHELRLALFSKPVHIVQLLAATVLIGLISGIYPAFYLSSFNPSRVLKGAVIAGKGRGMGRNVLVVGQFACAAFLIVVTIFVVKQLMYMRHKDPGFNREQVMIISGAYKNYEKLKNALLKSPLVKSVTGSSQSLGNNFHQTGFMYRGSGAARELAASHVLVDEDFIPQYQLKMAAGRGFTREGNEKELIINEAFARELLKDDPKAGYESLLGQNLGDSSATIVGIAKDFHFNSMHAKIETLCMLNIRSHGFHDVSVKVSSDNTAEAIKFVEQTYKEIIPHFPFSYKFLDEHFDHLYRSDEKVSKVIGVLGFLAIVIASLGLLGLAAHSAEKRVKEIGVRKVLGASVNSIVTLLSKDFLKLVILANIIAWPLAWLVVSSWLQNYAFHIEISWWVFIAAGLGSLFIAFFSVGSQTLSAATSNPVNSLRSE